MPMGAGKRRVQYWLLLWRPRVFYFCNYDSYHTVSIVSIFVRPNFYRPSVCLSSVSNVRAPYSGD